MREENRFSNHSRRYPKRTDSWWNFVSFGQERTPVHYALLSVIATRCMVGIMHRSLSWIGVALLAMFSFKADRCRISPKLKNGD